MPKPTAKTVVAVAIVAERIEHRRQHEFVCTDEEDGHREDGQQGAVALSAANGLR
jgi:hypothetical protein